MKKLSIISSHLPIAFSKAGSPRLYGFCSELSKSYELHLLSPFRKDEVLTALDGNEIFKTITTFPSNTKKPSFIEKAFHRMLCVPSALHVVRNRKTNALRQEFLARWLAEINSDGTLFHGLELAQLIKGSSIPKNSLFDAVDSYSLLNATKAKTVNSFTQRLALRVESLWWRFFERLVIKMMPTAFISKKDAEFAGGSGAYIISNGLDHSWFALGRNPSNPPEILFYGVMNYEPNVDAAIWFARSILPLVREHLPHASFQIVGASPTEEVKALSIISGVKVWGEVPEIGPHLEKASVFVCPMRLGAGMKNKLLQSLAAKVPTVATSQSIEGLRFPKSESLRIADSEREFASAVVDQINSKTSQGDLSEYIATDYSWSKSAEQIAEIIAQ